MKSKELAQKVIPDKGANSGGLQQALDALATDFFGRSLSDAHKSRLCVMCGGGPFSREDFEDDLSWREYGISGMCQDCQDLFFVDGDEALPEDWKAPIDLLESPF